MLRVIVVLEFNGINDADGEKASNITDIITDECLILQHELGADACYVDDVVVDKEDEQYKFPCEDLTHDTYKWGIEYSNDEEGIEVVHVEWFTTEQERNQTLKGEVQTPDYTFNDLFKGESK